MTNISRRDTMKIAGLAGAAAAAGGTAAEAQIGPKPALTLVLVNDIYKMSEQKGRGGFARLNAIVKAERAKGPVLYCHAGDCFSPSLMSGFDQGAHIVELQNVAAPDIFVPGNHEFDHSKDNYLKLVGESKYPYFAANLRGPGNTVLPKHKDRAMFELGGLKVGVFGVALQMTPQMANSGDLVFSSEMDTVRAQAKALRDEGADLVVAVTHTDFATDLAIMRSRAADVLLTGHDHDLRVVYDNRVVMVESGEEGEYVTAIDILADVTTRDGKRVVSWKPQFRVIDSATVTPDPETLAIVKKYEAELSKELDIEIGSTAVELDSRSATVRSQEAIVGNLIADAIRDVTGAQIGIANGGGIRGNKVYPAGSKLTRRDILTELPFGNTTVLVEISGAQVKEAFENGVSQIDNRAGRFPQISGGKFEFDPKAPAGSRITSFLVDGKPLDPAAKYTVAANEFILAGGDGYTSLNKGKTLIGATDGKLMASVVMSYIRKLGALQNKLEGRIVIK